MYELGDLPITEVLAVLGKEAPTKSLRNLAKLTRSNISTGLSHEDAFEEFTQELSKIIPKMRRKYRTPAFQCLADYEECVSTGSSKYVCAGVLTVCLAERLIPLA